MDQIYSLGDFEMLTNALQGVAMIFGTPSLQNLAGGGFTLGILFICTQYVVSQRFNPNHLLTGFIVYSVMFIPVTTVSVEDAYTNQVRTVANVPLGVAAPMSLVSTIGLRMAQLFETAFSIPTEASMVENGYMDALTTLLKMRSAGIGTAGTDGSTNTDVAITLSRYMDMCVMFDVQQNFAPQVVSRAVIMNTKDLWGSLQTGFVNRDIIVSLPDGGGTRQLNCYDAYNAIDAHIRSTQFTDAWYSYINGLLGYPDNATAADSRVDNAMKALNITAVDAQTFMRNALIASFLRDGPSAFIQRPALEQLQMEWAAEEGIFQRIARPLMAFVETFTVAISPVAAFLVTLGPMGIGVAVRYLQLVAWIALWGPVMAVCNMYIAIASTRAIDALSRQAVHAGADISSMVMHDRLFSTLELWVSTGGMLAASTPLLALSLVYGGPVVANSLSGRFMGGAKLAPEKTLAPDPMNVSPAMTVSPRMQTSSVTGASTSPGVGQFTYSMAKTANSAVSSTASAMKSAGAQVTSTQSQMLSGSTSTGNRVTDGDSFTQSMMHSQGKQDTWAAQTSQNMAKGITSHSTEQQAISHGLTGALGASLQAGGDIPIIGGAAVKAAVNEQLMSTGGVTEERADTLSSQAAEQYSRLTNNSDEYRGMKSYAASHGSESILSSESMRQKAQQWASALNAQVTATEQYGKVASLANSGGIARDVKADELGYALYKYDDGETNNRYRELMQGGPQMARELSAATVKAADGIVASGVRMPGDHFDLATKFLAINSVRPDMGLEIARNTFTPSEQGVDTGLRPDTFKTGLKPDGIVKPVDAGAAQQSAGGDGDITKLYGNAAGSAGSMNGGGSSASGATSPAPVVNAATPKVPDTGGPSGKESPAPKAHPAPASGTDSAHDRSVPQTHASGADGDSSNAERRTSTHGKPDIWAQMEKVADNRGIPLDRATAGNASGHSNHAPSSWGDILKNNVGKMPIAPVPPPVPTADAVKKDIDNKNLGQNAMDRYNEKGGVRGTNATNLEGALMKEGGEFKNKLGTLRHMAEDNLKDLGGSVRENVLPSDSKK